MLIRLSKIWKTKKEKGTKQRIYCLNNEVRSFEIQGERYIEMVAEEEDYLDPVCNSRESEIIIEMEFFKISKVRRKWPWKRLELACLIFFWKIGWHGTWEKFCRNKFIGELSLRFKCHFLLESKVDRGKIFFSKSCWLLLIEMEMKRSKLLEEIITAK